MRKSMVFAVAMALLLTGCGERPTAVEVASVESVRVDEHSSLQRDLARWYNVNLLSDTPEEGFRQTYGGILWYEGGVMGYVEIPTLGRFLPIFHEGGNDGFIHDANTAFPIGGRGNYTVLICDTPLALTEGEQIQIWILGETLRYTVGQSGEDTCTLVCGGTEYICGRTG